MREKEREPLVSVLMGVYNCKNHAMLEQAVHSILQQTVSNLELIICDDGSTDETSCKLVELAEQDSRIRLLRNETNQHLAVTLNRCIIEAKGEYLARQDDDDISNPQRLEKQIAFLKEHPQVDFVGTDCCLYDLQRGIHGHWYRPSFPVKQDFLFNSPFIHGSVLFRKHCFSVVSGYPIMPNIPRYEDYMLFMQLYASGMQGANLSEHLYTFYFDPKQRKVPFSERIDEVIVRWNGFRLLGLLPRGLPYVVKPILLGFLPKSLLHWLRKWKKTN